MFFTSLQAELPWTHVNGQQNASLQQSKFSLIQTLLDYGETVGLLWCQPNINKWYSLLGCHRCHVLSLKDTLPDPLSIKGPHPFDTQGQLHR